MQRNNGGNYEHNTYSWDNIGLAFRLYFISSSVMLVSGIFNPDFMIAILDIPCLVFESAELWRILIPFYAQSPQIFSFVHLLLSFLWMFRLFNEKQVSSVYIFLDILIQSLQLHILFNLVCFCIVSTLFDSELYYNAFGYGWWSMIIILQFRRAHRNPEENRYFCCLPFPIRAQNFPWIVAVVFLLIMGQFVCVICATVLGWAQQVWRGSNFIKLPYGLYCKLDSLMPQFVHNCISYTSVQKVSGRVRALSYGQGSRINAGGVNQNSSSIELRSGIFSGQGVAIQQGDHDSSPQDYRQFWSRNTPDQSYARV